MIGKGSANAARVKELYQNMNLLLGKIQYEKYKLNIGEDFKVITNLQLEYTKHFCILLE